MRSGAHLAANKYGQPILGLIFLRYADILYRPALQSDIPSVTLDVTLNGTEMSRVLYTRRAQR